ncbi:tautomerase family protein [Nitrogeniibacter aestuarii]|uniref:tautomerase family protein n=1 Tax=Nitrogeniibacter aestuarii TaxID=2815343 RepID=UPI001D1233B1|nr:4-oxalocrotonate tautomerase family protein [Nitrogeniibacter aestuarii]
MPIIDIKVFKDELSPEQSRALIARITDAVTEVTSEKLREVTWVTVTEVKDGHWGVGGKAIGLPDVKAMIAS